MVMYPLKKLLNKNERELTSGFKKAIRRIFRILDTDHDGWLTDDNIT